MSTLPHKRKSNSPLKPKNMPFDPLRLSYAYIHATTITIYSEKRFHAVSYLPRHHCHHHYFSSTGRRLASLLAVSGDLSSTTTLALFHAGGKYIYIMLRINTDQIYSGITFHLALYIRPSIPDDFLLLVRQMLCKNSECLYVCLATGPTMQAHLVHFSPRSSLLSGINLIQLSSSLLNSSSLYVLK